MTYRTALLATSRSQCGLFRFTSTGSRFSPGWVDPAKAGGGPQQTGCWICGFTLTQPTGAAPGSVGGAARLDAFDGLDQALDQYCLRIAAELVDLLLLRGLLVLRQGLVKAPEAVPALLHQGLGVVRKRPALPAGKRQLQGMRVVGD